MSSDELLGSLRAFVSSERSLVVKMIAYLVEVEDRRFHLELACSSMFDFCTRKLEMSEGEACRRIAVARLVRRFPALLTALESKRLHLSNIELLKDLLTSENVDELTTAAAGKTKREVEALVARLAPKPDVPSTIRKLPNPVFKSESAIAPTLAIAPTMPSSESGPSEPTAGTSETREAGASGSAAGAAQTARAAVRAASQLVPLAEDRHKVQFTASTALREKLERLRGMMRHRNPSGDLEAIVEAAADALLEKFEKAKLGKPNRKQRTQLNTPPSAAAAAASTTTTVTATVTATATATDAAASAKGKRPEAMGRYIAKSTRREVTERDDGQCAFRGADGERCPAREFLEVDHCHPRALGGTNDAANLRLLCREHNRFAAECVFGKAHVAKQIHRRQRGNALRQVELEMSDDRR